MSWPTHDFVPDASLPMRDQFVAYIKSLQLHICSVLESIEGPNGKKFVPDPYMRHNNAGFGISSTLRGGTHIEKAGVGVTLVTGSLTPAAIKQMRANHGDIPESTEGLPFIAAGISLIVHPQNPMAPTVHMNYRYFELCEPSSEPASVPAASVPEGTVDMSVPKATGPIVAWWFGGGCDLTPSYVFPEDAEHFHRTLKIACDAHSTLFYPEFKKWCDEYFYIPHRQEARGLGGIFFDDLSQHPHARLASEKNGVDAGTRPVTPDAIFAFSRQCGDAFVPSYLTILARRIDMPFTEDERRWQLLRRGRYVEFNLMYDRGTKFGLSAPGARIESILMSLPETARWEYYTDLGAQGTRESELVGLLRTPRDWLSVASPTATA